MKETGDPREYEAFIREIDDSRYAIDKDMVPRGVIPKRRGMSLSRSLAMEGIFPFTNFSPRLLASLVASSTAACTSGVVTVTATAHLIPATSFNGYSFYYPGSASLAAGWYSGFSRIDADTITFSAPLSANFASESINADAAFVSEVTFESFVIPKNTCVVGDRVVVATYRASNNTVGYKVTRVKIGSNAVLTHTNSSTTAICGASDLAFTFDSATTAVGSLAQSGTLTATMPKVAADIETDLTVSITGQLSAAAMYLSFIAAKLRIE